MNKAKIETGFFHRNDRQPIELNVVVVIHSNKGKTISTVNFLQCQIFKCLYLNGMHLTNISIYIGINQINSK